MRAIKKLAIDTTPQITEQRTGQIQWPTCKSALICLRNAAIFLLVLLWISPASAKDSLYRPIFGAKPSLPNFTIAYAENHCFEQQFPQDLGMILDGSSISCDSTCPTGTAIAVQCRISLPLYDFQTLPHDNWILDDGLTGICSYTSDGASSAWIQASHNYAINVQTTCITPR